MSNILLMFRIIITPILCVLYIYFIIDDLFYYPLSFGLVIGLINWKFHKYKPFLGVFFSVLVSYASFFIAYFSIIITGEVVGSILDINGDESKGVIAFIISPFIIAPMLVFLSYMFVFNIPKTKLTMYVVLFSVIFLVLQSYFFFYYVDSYSIDLSGHKILNPYTIWQIIMALAIQLIINQKLYVEKFSSKPIVK